MLTMMIVCFITLLKYNSSFVRLSLAVNVFTKTGILMNSLLLLETLCFKDKYWDI